jgi:Ca-activated chloride channel family protein
VPLVSIYPSDGTAEADFPYLILNSPWANPMREAVAEAFGRYARGPEGRDAFLAAGFRDSNRLPGPALIPGNGVEERIVALPRAILLPESVENAAAAWTAVTRPTNALLVFDTSGSMASIVPGTGGKTRLDLTKAAAHQALDLFDPTARVGVWSFANAVSRLEPIAALGSLGPDGQTTHLQAVSAAIDNLVAGGNTNLYSTVDAACQEVEGHRLADAANLVVLLTDGADDNNTGSLTLNDLTNQLHSTCGDPNQPVRVVTVGLGVKADSQVLSSISRATGADSFSSPTSFDISQVLLNALFS